MQDLPYIFWMGKNYQEPPNVNNNPENNLTMKDQTVLVKRSIEKDGLPKKDGRYNCFILNEGDRAFNYYFNGESFEDDEDCIIMGVVQWLEEVPLSSLIESRMPTDARDQIIKLLYSCAKTEKVPEGIKTTRLFDDESDAIIEWLQTQLTSKP